MLEQADPPSEQSKAGISEMNVQTAAEFPSDGSATALAR
jgi:hypothetical protein